MERNQRIRKRWQGGEDVGGREVRKRKVCTALQWRKQASENRFNSGSLVHLCPSPHFWVIPMFQESGIVLLESQSRIGSLENLSVQRSGEPLSLTEDSAPRNLWMFKLHNSNKDPSPGPKGPRPSARFLQAGQRENLQNSGSVFVCWLVCWWDWVYWANWLDWCVVGWLGAVCLACWFSDWYCSSSLFLLMADCSCCLITRIWPSSSDSSWTSGFLPAPTPTPGPQSPAPKPRHCPDVMPCPELPCPGPSPCPNARPNKSERPLELVTMGRCFSSRGREWGWGRGDGGGGGGRSWDDGRSRSFCISCGRTLRLLQWEDSAGFQDADWLFPSLHLKIEQKHREIWAGSSVFFREMPMREILYHLTASSQVETYVKPAVQMVSCWLLYRHTCDVNPLLFLLSVLLLHIQHSSIHTVWQNEIQGEPDLEQDGKVKTYFPKQLFGKVPEIIGRIQQPVWMLAKSLYKCSLWMSH